jgi:DNA primase catalytic core
MLAKSTIESVQDLSIYQVISKHVDLKKTGSQYKGMSPFVDEKSGSFMVSESKNCWKCFSSGNGGSGGVSFIMKVHSITWLEAIIKVAEENNILIEYDDSERSKKYIDKQIKRKTIFEVNALALEFYSENISKLSTDQKRASDELIEQFSIGFAPNEFKGLYNFLLSKGISVDLMLESGLIRKSEKENVVNYYDFFRDRIMFPIHDEKSGNVVGFSGRYIGTDSNQSKYLNSVDSEIYSKTKSVLGLFLSKREISKLDQVIVVEGNFDMLLMHQYGILNCVSPLGTALTKEHIEIISKYSKNWILAVDNDSAGLKRIEKDTILLLEQNCFVEIWVPEGEKNDPDSYLRSSEHTITTFPKYFNENKVDAVMYLAENFFAEARTPIQVSKAEERLVQVLAKVGNASLRNKYVREFVKTYKIDKTSVEKSVSISMSSRPVEDLFETEEKGYKLPSFLKEDDKADWNEYGFYALNSKKEIGYYFPTTGFTFERITNFIIKPLFQVSSKQDSKRLIEIESAFKTVLIELPNKAIVNSQLFEELVSNEGDFWFDGSKNHFKKLRRKLLAQFPFSVEIKTLGWQKDGFFSFADGIVVDGVFKRIDQNGLVMNDDKKYYLPAFSRLNNSVNPEDDEFESDRQLEYRTSKLTIDKWSELMIRVHLENGMWATMYFITTLFRDFIFAKEEFFPILFLFGQPTTGKSTCSRSINSIFYKGSSGFNLQSGTPVGFFRRLSRGRNCITWFDEYNNEINDQRFGNLKGSYDGAGHEKGMKTNDNRTQVTKVNTGILISGQFMPTRDDNSLFTRVILLTFERKQEDLTEEDRKSFSELSEYEKKGMSNLIVEVLKYRDYFEENFKYESFEVETQMKKDLMNSRYDGRVLKNFSLLCAVYKIVGAKLNLSFSYKQLYDSALIKVVDQSDQIKDSDALAGFWKIVSFMSYNHMITINHDYKILNDKSGIRIRKGRDEFVDVNFDSPKKLIYLNLTKTHPLYLQEHRKQNGISGITEQSIKSFMKTHKAFVGIISAFRFEQSQTSAYVFDYEKLGISMKEHYPATGADSNTEPTQAVPVPQTANQDEELPF